MKPLKFPNSRLPWRIIVPRRLCKNGKRKSEYFATRDAAIKRIKEIELDGRAAVSRAPEVAESDRAVIARAISLVGGNPLTLLDAARIHAQTLRVPSYTVREACERFQEQRASFVTKTTHDSDRYRLLKLLRDFSSVRLTEIDSVTLRHWLPKHGTNARSVYKTLRVFFKWAHEYGYLLTNPMANISPPCQFGVRNEIYTPEQFEGMLEAARSDRYLPLLRHFALCGFCGLRTCEAHKITSSDMYLDRTPPFVHVRREVAKGSRQRYITLPGALSALGAWISHIPPQAISDRQLTKLMGDFRLDTGFQTPHNGLRNLFCSYALNLDGVSAGDVAKSAGNSEAVLARHYVQHMPPTMGTQWFGIRP